MSNFDSRWIYFLTPISFILSLIAFILILSDAKDFTENKIAKKEPIIISSNEKSYQKNFDDLNEEEEKEEIKKTTLNETSKAIEKNETTKENKIESKRTKDIDEILSDLESLNEIKIQKKPEKKEKDISEIIFNSYNDKDQAILELNKLRKKHRDILSKIDSSVVERKKHNQKKYLIIGKSKNTKLLKDVYEKSKSKGLKFSTS